MYITIGYKSISMGTVVLEKILESLDCKEIQPVHPKGDHSWVFMLNFVNIFFCIYGEDHMVFIPQFVNVVYQADLQILKNPCMSGLNPT